MPVNDHSIGRLYLAQMRLEGPTAKRSWVSEIREECEPWRRGKAHAFTVLKRRALLLGWWRPHKIEFQTDEERSLFGDDQWLDPQQMFVPPSELGEWDDGRTEEERAQLKRDIEANAQAHGWNMGTDAKGNLERCCPTDDACEMHRALDVSIDPFDYS